MSESEKTLVQTARALAKLERKRAEAAHLLADYDAQIEKVRGEIPALVPPPKG